MSSQGRLQPFRASIRPQSNAHICPTRGPSTQRQLDSSEILRATADQRRLGAAQRLRQVVGAAESERIAVESNAPSHAIRIRAYEIRVTVRIMENTARAIYVR